MLTAKEVTAIRKSLGMEVPQFAKLLDVDARSVQRWETENEARPTGPAEAVLIGIREKLESDPKSADKVVKFVLAAAAVGGLAYLLIKLFDQLTDESKRKD